MPVLFFFLIVAGIFAAATWGVGTVVLTVLRDAPWVLILIGVWMLVAPRRGRRHRRWPQATAGRPTAPPPPAAKAAPVTAAAAVKPKRELPIDVRVKVEQIKHKADVLQGYADRFSPFSHDLHVVRQTAAEYLPRTIDAYLALGEGELQIGGKSAVDELKEQLDLLDKKLDEIAANLQQEDVDRLLANRRFLEEKFSATDAA
jgi:hypothetical protein